MQQREEWRDEWNEVQDHRYDAYWLGRIHPFFRKLANGPSMSTGIGLCIVGVASIAGAIWTSWRAGFIAISVIFILLGVSNIRASRA